MFQATQDLLTLAFCLTAILSLAWLIVEYLHFTTLTVRPTSGPIPPGETCLGRLVAAVRYILTFSIPSEVA